MRYATPPARFVRPLVAMTAAITLLGAAPTSAANAGRIDPLFRLHCEQNLRPSNFAVTYTAQSPVYDFTRSIEQLTRQSRRQSASQHALGLTASSVQFGGKWNHQAITDHKTGLTCLRPSATIEIKSDPQIIYIAREFTKGTCAFQEILKHELRHAKANDAQARHVQRVMQQRMSAHYGNRILYGEHSHLVAQLQREIQDKWLTYARALYDRVDDVHRQIDSPAEYARNHTMCGGAVPKILKNRRLHTHHRQ